MFSRFQSLNSGLRSDRSNIHRSTARSEMSGRKKVTASSFDPTADHVPEWVKPASAKAAPPKRKLSAAGRKAIADAAKKRWALVKTGKAASPFAVKGTKKAAK